MVDGRPERVPRARLMRVVRTERLTPHMVRVVFTGDDLADLEVGEFTDHYIKLLFPPADAAYSSPFDLETVRRERPRAQWPAMRTYTIRAFDPDRREMTVDFVVHGDEGLAGPWADTATEGDLIQFAGPGGGYVPRPDADWHLLIGDESAIPAIAATLERIPATAPVRVFVEVADRSEEQVLTDRHDVAVTWVHRTPGAVALADVVARADLPTGTPHPFVHGEAGAVRQLRRFLRQRLRISADAMSVSGYWSKGRTDEGWRAAKADWRATVEADDQVLAG